MIRYYTKDCSKDMTVFNWKLEQLHNQVDGATLEELLKIRRKLYALKRKYEESGNGIFYECEVEIIAINEVISDCRAELK